MNNDKSMARTSLEPEPQSAAVLAGMKPYSSATVEALLEELTAQTAAVSQGDMSRPEGMLITQAHVLSALFGKLTAQAINAIDPKAQVDCWNLALRAQRQCQASLQTLTEIKALGQTPAK